MPFLQIVFFCDAFLRYASLRTAFLRVAIMRYASLRDTFLRDALWVSGTIQYHSGYVIRLPSTKQQHTSYDI